MTAAGAAGLSTGLFYAGLGLLVVGALRVVKHAEGPWGLALLALGAVLVGAGIVVAVRNRGGPPRRAP